MKKTNIYLLMLSAVLCACTKQENISTDEKSTIQNNIESSTNDSSDEVLSEQSTTISQTESISRISEKYDFIDDLEYDKDLIADDSIVLSKDDKYNIYGALGDNSPWLEMYTTNKDLVSFDIQGNIIGKNIGNVEVYVVVDETVYDIINIEIKDLEEMRTNFSTSSAFLQNKTVTIFGASVSDPAIKPYSDDFVGWYMTLETRYHMTVNNFAKSGSTVGFCRGLGSSHTSIMADTLINLYKCKTAVENSDFVFLNLGNNDGTQGCNIGDYDDVNDDNYLVTESLKGSYAYLLRKIYSYNPNVKIVALGPAYSTWTITPYSNNEMENYTYAKTRKQLSDVIKDVAEHENIKFIPLIDLWDNETIKTYAPDGIHPNSEGHELMIQRLLGNI